MVIPKINSAHGSDTRNIINRNIDVTNAIGKAVQDLVAKGQLTPTQYAQLIAIVNDTAKVNDLDDLRTRFNEVIKTTPDNVSSAEIIDARLGRQSLGEMVRDINDRVDIQLNNIMGDGDFKFGLDEWNPTIDIELKHSNGMLKAERIGTSGWIRAEKTVNLEKGKSYYIAVKHFKQSSDSGQYSPGITAFYTDDSTERVITMDNNTIAQEGYTVFKPSKDVAKIQVISYPQNIGAYFLLDKIMVIDLSENYGDKIPQVEEFKSIIDEYFGGFIANDSSLSHSIQSLMRNQMDMNSNLNMTLENIVDDGKFENGLDNWMSGINVELSLKSERLRGNKATEGANIRIYKDIELKAHRKYFLSIGYFKQSEKSSTNARVNINYADGTFEVIKEYDLHSGIQSAALILEPSKDVSRITILSYTEPINSYFEIDDINLIDLSNVYADENEIPSPLELKNMIDKFYKGDKIKQAELSDVLKTLMSNVGGTNVMNAVDISTTLNLEAHGLSKTTGMILTSTSSNYSGMKRTGKFLKTVPGTSVKLDFNYGNYTIFEYDVDFKFISQSVLTSGEKHKLSNVTDKIKIMSENSEGLPKLIFQSISGKVEWIKNQKTTTGNHNFIYEVYPHVGRDIFEPNGSEELYTKERYFNSGLLKLPPNYNPTGEPVKLIIFCHGSADYSSITAQSFGSNFEEYFQYLVDEGYAMMDVYSWTTKYPEAYGANFGSPISISALAQGYQWVIDNYNIDTNGVFLSSKSAGGYQSLNLCYNKGIPIKAAGILSPGLSPLNSPYGYDAVRRIAYAQDFNFEGDTERILGKEGSLTKDEELKDYMRLNAEKIVGYNPFWNGIINANLETLIEDAVNNTDTYENYKDKVRVCHVPTKIWSAVDEAGYYEQKESYIQSIKNANGIAEIRHMPANTGGHNAVDSSPDALKVDSIKTRLGITHTNVPLAYVELMQFFKRFES